MTRFPRVRSALLADRSFAESLATTIMLLVAATAIRLMLHPVVPNLTFVSYYPMVLLVTLLAGWRWGLAGAVAGGIVALRLFYDQEWSVPEATELASLAVFLLSCAVIILTGNTLRRTVRELKAANDASDYLNAELQHRVGNTLAIVQAIASQTLRLSPPENFAEVFGQRLLALDNANRMMGRTANNTCDLRELVVQACAPFCADSTLETSGPDVCIPARSCIALALCLHELCTNATKHGALRNPEGKVTISWSITGEGLLTILWAEKGGPPVAQPVRRGLGTRLLTAQSGIDLIEVRFKPLGVQCEIVISGVELATRKPASPGE